MKKYLFFFTLLFLFAGNSGAITVQIGSGTTATSYFPLYSCYVYNYSQQIYLGSEIAGGGGGAGTINKIRFYYVSSGPTYANWTNWTVYMGNTAKTAFSGTTDWVPVGSMTQVFSGNIPTPIAGTWIELTLTTPFSYTGANLVVAVDENAAGYSCTATWRSFTTGSNRGMLYYDDVINPDPISPPAANYSPNPTLSQIQLDMTITPPSLSALPTSLSFGYIPGGSTSAAQSYILSGGNLLPAAGTIVVTAPAGFRVSKTAGSGFSDSVHVAYSGGSLPNTTLYAKFAPTGPPANYSGNINNVGGGAIADIDVTGTSDPYCPSMASSVDDEEIYSVTVGGITNAYNCVTVAPGPGSILKRYSNFFPLGSLWNLGQSASIPFTIEEDECDGPTYFDNGCAVWIDFNQDGDFTDPGEQVYSETVTTSSPRTISGNILVPPGAVLGQTVMRITVAEGYFGATLTSCLSYGYGETEDYLVTITDCHPPFNLTANAVSGISANLSWTPGATETAWEYVYGVSPLTPPTGPGTSTTSSTVNPIAPLQLMTTYQYYVRANCGTSFSAWSGPYTFTTLPTQYCIPVYSTGCIVYNIGLTCFQLNTINQSITCTGTPNYYHDYTSSSTDLGLNGNYLISVTAGGYYEHYANVWIDYNHNNFFDVSSELAGQGYCNGGGTAYIPITIPSASLTGSTRLRAMANYESYPANPCDFYSYGNCADFTVNIVHNCAPLVYTTSATYVSGISSVLNGQVNPNGFSSTVSFEYGLTTSYGTTVAGSPSPLTGFTNSPVSASISGLSMNTIYHYRAISTYLGGTSYGADMTFLTLPYPYCIPVYSSGCDLLGERITYFELNTIAETIPCTGVSSYYHDYTVTSISTDLYQSGDYVISVQGGYQNTYARVWIDYNHNNFFDRANEEVGIASCYEPGVTYTIPFNVSASALTGVTRLRAMSGIVWDSDPCSLIETYGNCIDFTLNILACQAPAAAGPISGTAQVCQGSSGDAYYYVEPIANATGYEWSLPPGGTIATGFNTDSITVNYSGTATSGNVTVYATHECGSIGATSPPFAVTVNPQPDPTITGPATACAGSSGNIYTTEAGMTGYEWTVSSGGTITNAAATSLVTESFENGGNIPPGWITETVSGGNTISFVTSTSYPPGYSAYNGTYLVMFDSYTVSGGVTRLIRTTPISTTGCASAVVDFAWLESSNYPTFNDKVEVQYSVNGTSWTTAGTFNRYNAVQGWKIKNQPLPPDALGQPTLYIAFLFTSGYGNDCYLDFAHVTANTLNNTVNVTWNAAGAQSVSVNYTNSYGCSAADTTTCHVTVNQLPVPTINGPATACVSSTGNVYATQAGMSNYSWTVPGGTVTSGSGTDSITVTWNTAGMQNIFVTYTTTFGCNPASPAVYPVAVNPLPDPTITGPTSVCVNSADNIYTTQSGMSGYLWNISAGGTITAGSGTNAITVTWSMDGAQTVSVNYSSTLGCTAASPTVYNTNVNPLPVPTISGPTPVCNYSTGNVYFTEPAMTNYLWTIPSGATVTAGGTSCDNSVTLTFTTTGTKPITVNYTTQNGCAAASPSHFMVTVYPSPVPSITGPSTGVLCGVPTVYSTVPFQSNYIWIISTSGTIISGHGTKVVVVQWASSGPQWISLNYTNASGCSAPAPTIKNVTISGGVCGEWVQPTITGPASVCGVPNTGNVYYTEEGKSNYFWYVTEGGTITGGLSTADIIVTWETAGVKTVTVHYNNSNGSVSAEAFYSVTVQPLPPASLTLTNITVNNGQSVCHQATQTVTAGGSAPFLIKTGGSADLVAGQTIVLLQGSSIESGGYLHAFISPQCGYCDMVSMAAKAVSGTEGSNREITFDPPINSKTDDFFKVYPNPTTGTFTLELSEVFGNSTVTVEVYGMYGEKLMNEQFIWMKNHDFSLEEFPPGIYLIHAFCGVNQGYQKIIKQ